MMKIEDKIIDNIKKNSKISRYQKLEELINNNEKIKNDVNKLKGIQKEIVHAKEYNKAQYLIKLESEYSDLYESVIKHPIMAEYLDLQQEINSFLQEFTNIIEKGINGDFTVNLHKK